MKPLQRILGCITLLAAATLAPGAPPTAPAAKRYASLEQWALANSKAALDQAEQDGNFATAQVAALKVFDTLVAYGTEKNAAAFREASFTLRLLSQLSHVEGNVELLKFL